MFWEGTAQRRAATPTAGRPGPVPPPAPAQMGHPQLLGHRAGPSPPHGASAAPDPARGKPSPPRARHAAGGAKGHPYGLREGTLPGSPRTEGPRGRDGTRRGRGAARLPPPAQAGPRRAAMVPFPPSAALGRARLGLPAPRSPQRSPAAAASSSAAGGGRAEGAVAAADPRARARRSVPCGRSGRRFLPCPGEREERGGDGPGRGGVRRERGTEAGCAPSSTEGTRRISKTSARCPTAGLWDAKVEQSSESRARVLPTLRFPRGGAADPERRGAAQRCAAAPLAALGHKHGLVSIR